MIRTPIRRKLTPSIKELDDMARTLVMLRANAGLATDEGRNQWYGACQRCLRTGWLSWCHVFTRAARSVRWDEDNAWAWCRGCHRYMDQHWEQKRDWVIAKIGQERFDMLKLRSNGRRVDLAGMRVSLKQRLQQAGVA
jgi:5-methylcytosine-specific restriction endonuclease McrA